MEIKTSGFSNVKMISEGNKNEPSRFTNIIFAGDPILRMNKKIPLFLSRDDYSSFSSPLIFHLIIQLTFLCMNQRQNDLLRTTNRYVIYFYFHMNK